MNLTILFEPLLSLVSQWVNKEEAHILKHGIPLNTDQQIDAHLIGVKGIPKIRLMRVEEIPLPAHPVLLKAAKMTGLITGSTAGISLGYGIYIRTDCWGDRSLVVHELTHTMQYERFGCKDAFLRQYLQECLTQGYPNGELELEAIRMERKVCG